MSLKKTARGLLTVPIVLLGGLFARDELITIVWLGPDELEQYEQKAEGNAQSGSDGDDTLANRRILFVRPDGRALVITNPQPGNLAFVDMVWRGTPGHRWGWGLFHWAHRVPILGPNWRWSDGRPVFMHMASAEDASESSREFIIFGDNHLRLGDARFERVATDRVLYCGFVTLAEIADYTGSPCSR